MEGHSTTEEETMSDEYQPINRLQFRASAKLRWIFAIPSYIICLLMIIVYCNVEHAAGILNEEIKATIVHDTLYLPPPKIYTCWNCKKELVGISKDHPIQCCDYEYRIVDNELIAKKLK